MTDKTYMPKACEHCPFRADVYPFLRPLRGLELALNAANMGEFHCHKTLDYDHEYDGEGDHHGPQVVPESRTCAGHLSIMAVYYKGHQARVLPEGFQRDERCYESAEAMIEAYQNAGGQRGET